MSDTVVLHCELAWLGGEDPARDVRIDVDHGIITSVTDRTPAPPGAITLRGLTIPGLANAHSHAFHRALRGRTHGDGGTFWTWRDRMYDVAEVLEPDSYFALARAVFAEMTLAGITCVGEFHYVHHQADGTPYAEPDAMSDAIVAAAGSAGLRITLLDCCYLGGGLAPDGSLLPVRPEQRRFGDGTADAWCERVSGRSEGGHVAVGAAIHSVRAVDPASIATIAAWAAQHDRVLHAHVSEQPAENDQCHAAHGASPIGVLSDSGALGANFTAVHATHVGEGDVTLLASAGSTVCMCPTTERDLADGIAPTRPFRDAGIPLSLGTDSHAVVDVLEEARAVELDERLATGMRGNHTAPALLGAATVDGHRSLGWRRAGRIAPGFAADLTTISMRSVRTAGSDRALEVAVFAATAADVTDVFVAGEHLVADGRHRSIDVASELELTIRELWDTVEAGR